jgi:transposase
MTTLSPIVKCSAGLDVHQKTVVVCILTEGENGELKEQIKEFTTYPHHLQELADWLLFEGVELAIMESTGVYWKSVFETLETAGVKAHVVNAKEAKRTPGRKTDVSDSKWLATLARYGLLRNSFIPEKALRHLRQLTRYRVKLKGMIASEINRMHKTLNDSGIRLSVVFSDLQGVSARAVVKSLANGDPISQIVAHLKCRAKKKENELRAMLALPLSTEHRFVLKMISDHVDYLHIMCADIDRQIFDAMKPYDTYWKILQTIPGIDALGAAIIIAEIGVDMGQFGTEEQFCSWAGMCPGNNESAGKRRSAHINKGAPTLRKILCEAANSAVKTASQFKGYYQGLVVRRGHKRSIIATGHKLLRVIYKLFSTQKPYVDPQVNYEEMLVKRNAPRWIQVLTKYGYLATHSYTTK